MGGIEDLVKKLKNPTSERGAVTVFGRPIQYVSEGHWYKWELQHKVEVVDEWSQVRAKADNNLSWHTSLRYALTDLLQKLHEKGLLSGISGADLKAVATAVTECVEEHSKCSYSQQMQDQLLKKSGAHKTSVNLPSASTTLPQAYEAPPIVTTSSSIALSPQSHLPINSDSGSVLDPYVSSGNVTYLAVGVSVLIVSLTLVLCCCIGKKSQRRNILQSPDTPRMNIHSEGYVLTASDLPQLQKLLVDEAYQSFTMGIHLGLSVGVIRALQKDAPSDIFQFQGLILAKWLQCTSPRPTVQKLVDVISGPVIKNIRLACDIKEHYGLP